MPRHRPGTDVSDLTTIADASLRSDALCVAARISKLRFAALKSVDEHRAIRHAVEAFIHYKKAFDEYVTPHAAINAAAMAWIIGENAACRQSSRTLPPSAVLVWQGVAMRHKSRSASPLGDVNSSADGISGCIRSLPEGSTAWSHPCAGSSIRRTRQP